MRFEEKLRLQMSLRGMNQQRLAREAGVSDSEVSRILNGKSQPGMENALRLARAVGVSLDYLADAAQEAGTSAGGPDLWEKEVLALARDLGFRAAAQILLVVGTIGREKALRRLYGLGQDDDGTGPTDGDCAPSPRPGCEVDGTSTGRD